jgi:uncharacterized GH25 family protein
LKHIHAFRLIGLRGGLALAAVSVCAGAPALAHDFWLQPSGYWVSSGATTSMTLQVGHGPSRQRSPIPLRRIVRFQAIDPNGSATDLRGRLHLGGASADGDFALQKPGAHLLVFQTDNLAQSHLPSVRFNDYLNVEGLTPALDQRSRLHRMDRDGSENYSRCTKSIVEVGPGGSGLQRQVTRAFGLPLEIVPDRSPYALPRAAVLPVRVLYHGQPLAGALVKLTHLENDAVPLEMHRTDRAGRAIFAMPSGGTWLLNVIWTRAQPPSAETDFETVFSSLSFGLPGAPRAKGS